MGKARDGHWEGRSDSAGGERHEGPEGKRLGRFSGVGALFLDCVTARLAVGPTL